LHISEVTLPDGVEPVISDRDFTIATIAAPAALKSEDAGAEEGAEGEDGETEGEASAADESGGEEGGEE
jgi:large subunit ribosomal protein L25